MKHLLHLVVVIAMASTLHDVQQLVTRFSSSDDCSLDSNIVGDRAVGVLMTGVSAAPKRSQKSKLVFQIVIDASDPKKKKTRKRKGKKSLRANRRKVKNNRKQSNRRGRHQFNRRRHRNHYHTLRKEYKKKLKAILQHGNHYHKHGQRKKDLFNKRYRRPFGRKEMTFYNRRYGLKKPSRRPSNKHRPFLRNSRRGKQACCQDNHHRRKTSFRQNNRRRRPTISRRNQWRRTKKIRHRYSSSSKQKKKGRPMKRKGRPARNTPRRKDPNKFKAIEFLLYKDTKKN